MTGSIKTVAFGQSKQKVTRVGLGGEGVLRTIGLMSDARKVIFEAIDQGITYFDSARVYRDSEIYLGSVWKENPSLRQSIFQTSKSAERDKIGAMADLDQTLRRLNTDYIDLWQIHDVRTMEDFLSISSRVGALEAFITAKAGGKVRNIGVTGHHDPEILSRAVREWPVDSVLVPVNPVEGVLGGFLTDTLPAAKEKGIAIVGMKVLGASNYIIPEWDITAECLINYALSHDITTAVVGCSKQKEVQCLAKTGRTPDKLAVEKKKQTHEMFRPYAEKMAFYRGW
jgi:aryl-alcohol dehydrogenase-like predicted oxidoreductase